MLNKEVFEQFGSEQWVIEENLCYLLQEYAEKLGIVHPYNPVTFVKNFMKEETYVDTKYAEMSAVDTARENVVADYVDGEYIEIDRQLCLETVECKDYITLYCKPGDTIWFINEDNELLELIVDHIDINDNYIYYFTDERATGLAYIVSDDDFRESAFVNQSEAYAKLQKRINKSE